MQPTRTVGTSCLLALLASIGCGGGGGGNDDGKHGQIVKASIRSGQIRAGYELYVYLPPSYAASQDTYPVIYALDGQNNITAMKSALQAEAIEAVVVGIGREDRRDIDYLMPGASKYYAFITLELIPYVESHFRVQSVNRTIAGHSYGGLFVGLALFMDRVGGQYFSNFVSQDGSFWVDPPRTAAMEQRMFDESNGQLPVTLIMSGAQCCNYSVEASMYDQILSRGYQGLHAYELSYRLDHIGMLKPSFQDSMRILFPK
jgi:enterochelin esterase-like enzyme